MMNKIVEGLKKNVGTEVGTKLGLTTEQIEKGLSLAGTVATKVLNESMTSDPDTMKNLLSKETNTPQSQIVVDKIGTSYVHSLTKELGLDALKASALKDAVLPKLTGALVDIDMKSFTVDPVASVKKLV